jgi:hypothetical protein
VSGTPADAAIFMLFRFRKNRPTLAERAAPRLPAHATRAVRCYRCGRTFDASAHAESTSCPGCAGAVRIPDVTVTDGHWGGSIQTAGSVHVLPGCTVRSSLIVASGDVLIQGHVHAMVIAGGTVRVTAGAELKGGARCKTLVIEPGALVRGGPFEAPSNALGTIDIDAAARAVPGKGPAARVAILDALRPPAEPIVLETPIITRRPPQEPPRLRVVR